MTIIKATRPDGIIEQLAVDAILSETPTNTATITQHPVEEGANVADHIRPNATKLALALVVSNTPLARTAATVGAFASDLAERVHEQLVHWQEIGALLSIPTTFGLRTSYAIASIGAPRDAKTGGLPGHTGGLRISLQLTQIRIVQNKLTRVVVSKDRRVGRKVKTGKQPTKAAVLTNASFVDDPLGLTDKLTGTLAAYKKAMRQ